MKNLNFDSLTWDTKMHIAPIEHSQIQSHKQMKVSSLDNFKLDLL